MARLRTWAILAVAIIGAAQLAPKGTTTAPATLYSTPASTEVLSEKPPVRKARPTTLYITASNLNVRAAPKSGAEVLLQVQRGAAVAAVSSKDGWYEILLTDDRTGWISASYASASPPETAAPPVELAQPKKKTVDRSSVVRSIINASISSYPGPCACPYNRMRNGRQCGGNSAYSKRGGYDTVCYPGDVTEAMIEDYAARH